MGFFFWTERKCCISAGCLALLVDVGERVHFYDTLFFDNVMHLCMIAVDTLSWGMQFWEGENGLGI